VTEEERSEEGTEDAIEDLEAPAEKKEDVAGGRGCTPRPSRIECGSPTCVVTDAFCKEKSRTGVIVVYDQ
jgi:hypothetical protein